MTHVSQIRRASPFLCSAAALLFLSASALHAQKAGAGAPPATYDYDPQSPGVQPPTSPLLAGYTYRSVRSYQFTVPVLVSIKELASLLPTGFTPVPSSAGASTTTLNLGFFLDQRFQPDVAATGEGPVFGPTSALLASVTAVNSNVSPARQELVFPLFEASSDVDALNRAFGPGSARRANVTAAVLEFDGNLLFDFEVSDAETGFHIRVKAECPSAITTRSISDPVGLPFRTLNGELANDAFWAATQSDSLALSSADSRLDLDAPEHSLKFANGELRIMGVGPTLTFNRGVEFIVKFE